MVFCGSFVIAVHFVHAGRHLL